MASMAFSSTCHFCSTLNNYKRNCKTISLTMQIKPSIVSSHLNHPRVQNQIQEPFHEKDRTEVANLGAIFNFSGTKPNYLGVQKNPPGLALCPATNNCVSTSENISDLTHYVPPWNYNPDEGRGSEKPVSKEEAMEELLDVVESTNPDNFTPKITEQRDDYVLVEYQSPIIGLVDDVEFWFPPGKKAIVQYRSASRLGNFDFDINRKRIMALRMALEKKGWASENSF